MYAMTDSSSPDACVRFKTEYRLQLIERDNERGRVQRVGRVGTIGRAGDISELRTSVGHQIRRVQQRDLRSACCVRRGYMRVMM
jgi:hypothetical protein